MFAQGGFQAAIRVPVLLQHETMITLGWASSALNCQQFGGQHRYDVTFQLFIKALPLSLRKNLQ